MDLVRNVSDREINKVGMLSRLASYLLRGVASGAEDDEASATADAGPETGSASLPVEARLRQVEVEGDDWILIDRNGKCLTRLDGEPFHFIFLLCFFCFVRARSFCITASPKRYWID